MFSSLLGYFSRPDPKQAAKDAIIVLRQHLVLLQKKEAYLERRIEDELKKAKSNAVPNKRSTYLSSVCFVYL